MRHSRIRLRTLVLGALVLAVTGTWAVPAHAEPSTTELTAQIDEASNKLEDITESYNKLRIDLKRTVAAQRQLAASLRPAREELKVASAQVDDIAANAYKSGQVGAVNILLADDRGNIVDKLSLLEQLSRTRQHDIKAYTDLTENYAQKQEALRTTQARQTAQVASLAKARQTIEAELTKLYAMRKAAYGRATEVGEKYTGTVPKISGAAGEAVAYAYDQIGDAYLWGADGPDSFDCSGLTSKAWAAAGKSLPHNTAEQWNVVTHISRSQLKPGDLVFYRSLGHVGIYVGDDQIIHAPRAGTTVKKVSVDIMTPYGYGRVT